MSKEELKEYISTFRADKNIKLATYASRCIENEILMLIRVNKKHKDTISLETPIATDSGGEEMLVMDTIADESEDMDEKLNTSFVFDKIQSVIEKKLSKREREVVAKRYGLNGQKPQTQKEIAKEIGISRSYISRIEKKSLDIIKSSLDPKLFDKR